ncbi:MAG: hypothetical protein J6D37_00970 [Clostridia bacterium]|nr:hypothetical protein [Clostridia bacterium]
MKTVAVFFGGKSYEHEVSVLSGLLAVKLLNTKENKVLPVYVSLENELFDGSGKEVKDYADGKTDGFKPLRLVKGGLKGRFGGFIPVDCALNCCHGGLGEGGGLAALLEWFCIPSASPSMTESALFQNKYLTKLAVRSLGVPTAEGFCLDEEAFRKKKLFSLSLSERKFGYPVIVKPNRLGSSIGIAVANDREALTEALTIAFSFDRQVLVERYLPEKRDINCAVYSGERLVLSDCEEVLSKESFLSYEEKYERERKTALLDESLSGEIKALSARIYRRFSLKGVVRMDFIVSEGKPYFNELNVIPGSLAYYLFSPSLADGKKMLLSLVEGAEGYPKEQIPLTGLLKRPEIVRANSCKIR